MKDNASGPVFIRRTEPTRIQVGLDFGTSATKVAYFIHKTRGTRFLDFGHGLENFPSYCLPSVAAIDRFGNLLLGIPAARYLSKEKWDSGFQRFKVLVAAGCDEKFKDAETEGKFEEYRTKTGHVDSLTPERLTAIYLADTMCVIKEQLQSLPDLRSEELALSFNICVPIDYLENNKVDLAFKKVFNWAEAMYLAWQQQGGRQDPLRSSEKYKNAAIPDEESRVYGIPESVAQIAAYLASLRKREGLHAVVDFGAGTTDISIFNLCLHNPEAGTKSYWYAARNLSKGTINVERALAEYLRITGRQQICSHSVMRQYLSGLAQMCDEWPELGEAISRQIKDIFAGEEYKKVWGEAYVSCHRKQATWESAEVFVSGGGSRFPYVKGTLSTPWWPNIQGKYSVYPIPDTGSSAGDKKGFPFERLAVAYGLAIPKPMLEEYVLPRDSPDQTPAPLPYLLPDRDELYPK